MHRWAWWEVHSYQGVDHSEQMHPAPSAHLPKHANRPLPCFTFSPPPRPTHTHQASSTAPYVISHVLPTACMPVPLWCLKSAFVLCMPSCSLTHLPTPSCLPAPWGGVPPTIEYLQGATKVLNIDYASPCLLRIYSSFAIQN
jgi:hypothetical protein